MLRDDGGAFGAGTHPTTVMCLEFLLGLEPGADEAEIRSAHKRLLRQVHPDRGGSAYLARRVYAARDTLLAQPRKTMTRTGDDE